MASCEPPRWRPVWELALTLVVVLVCGLIGLVGFIVDVLRKGPSRMFHVRPRNVRPQVLDDPDYGTHQFVTLKEARIKLHYVICGREDRPLIVFVHGFPEFWYSWRYQIKELSKNYRVAAYDMRGFGESDAPLDVSGYTMDQLGDDLEQFITALGYERCVVVGHDWGGAAAWSCAVSHPHRVEKLIILNAPHLSAFFSHTRTAYSQIRKSWHMFLFQLPVLPYMMLRADDFKWLEEVLCQRPMGSPGTFSSEDIETIKYTFANYDWRACLKYFHGALRYRMPKFEEAVRRGKLAVRTLIIWGTGDGALDTELAELSSRYVQQCTIRYVEGASHWVYEEQPQLVNHLMEQFISGKLL